MVGWAEPLEAWRPELARRQRAFEATRSLILGSEGSLHAFCIRNGIHYFGLQSEQRSAGRPGGCWFREWAPTAICASLIGDFNGWNVHAHPCVKDQTTGVFSVFVPESEDGQPALAEGSGYKIALKLRGDGENWHHRVPAWARLTRQDPITGDICAVVATNIEMYPWRNERPPPPPSLKIYEAHVGMSSREPRVSTWAEFREHVLPHVCELGYTALLLQAVHEHGLYSSFGYQVTSFFAPSSRFGPPNELQALIDEAHRRGLLVLMDVVHSHASANTREGIGGMGAVDGANSQYFVNGEAGRHPVWGTRLFDFGRVEVLRFLLANLCWFAKVYRFDGFRFDAVSTALYTHRCIGAKGHFSGSYHEYFGPKNEVDVAAVVYYKLANLLCHASCEGSSRAGMPPMPCLGPWPLLTIAEDHSGMPGLCAPVPELGMGFDLRQAMAVAPLWASLFGASVDVLPVGRVVSTLCEGRTEERRVAYCESHDQAIVGGRTLAHMLMGPRLYDGMSIMMPACPMVERGIALHKISRLLTLSLGSHAYLTFMGNEFGHPEWIDFPREGNDHSFARARRQWELATDPTLRYSQLLSFERAMLALEKEHGWLSLPPPTAAQCCYCQKRQLICFTRARLFFVANLHPHLDITQARVFMSSNFSSVSLKPSTKKLGADHVTPLAHVPAPRANYDSKPAPEPSDARLFQVLSSDLRAFGGRAQPSSAVLSSARPHEVQELLVDVPAQTMCIFSISIREGCTGDDIRVKMHI